MNPRGPRSSEELRILALGLIPLKWSQEESMAAGFDKSFLEILRLLKFPRAIHKAEVYTTPEAEALMHGLAHAHKMWPLQAMREIIGLIGRAGLRTYHAAWALDAPETDLAELLNTLAADHKARTGRRRHQ